MKRILILFTLLCLLLTGCFSRGADLSADARHFGNLILSAVDDYLDGEKDASLTADYIQEQCYMLNGVFVPEVNMDNSLKTACEVLNYTMLQIAEAEEPDTASLLNARNEIARLMGEKQRG